MLVVVANSDGTLSASGRAGSAEPGSTVTITFPDGSTGTALVAADGSYGPVISDGGQNSGTVSAITTDVAGNSSVPATVAYTDRTAPQNVQTPIVVANPDGTLSVSGVAGAAEAGSTLTVTFPDGSTGTAVVAADGSYGPIDSSAPQTSGTVSAIATDAAGNSSLPTDASYTDSSAPVAPA
ncbi:MAG: Ig-like domain-containing protein, partial [Chania sp.]